MARQNRILEAFLRGTAERNQAEREAQAKVEFEAKLKEQQRQFDEENKRATEMQSHQQSKDKAELALQQLGASSKLGQDYLKSGTLPGGYSAQEQNDVEAMPGQFRTQRTFGNPQDPNAPSFTSFDPQTNVELEAYRQAQVNAPKDAQAVEIANIKAGHAQELEKVKGEGRQALQNEKYDSLATQLGQKYDLLKEMNLEMIRLQNKGKTDVAEINAAAAAAKVAAKADINLGATQSRTVAALDRAKLVAARLKANLEKFGYANYYRGPVGGGVAKTGRAIAGHIPAAEADIEKDAAELSSIYKELEGYGAALSANEQTLLRGFIPPPDVSAYPELAKAALAGLDEDITRRRNGILAIAKGVARPSLGDIFPAAGTK